MRSIVVNASPASAAPVYIRPSIARAVEFIPGSVKKVERLPVAVAVLMLIAVTSPEVRFFVSTVIVGLIHDRVPRVSPQVSSRVSSPSVLRSA
jgi:hypothetical protein